MNDVFKEQLVKVKKTTVESTKKVAIVIAAVIVSILALMFARSFLGPLLVVGAIIGASYLIKSMNLEYEYILTNNELDIDKIMNKERRKRCITIDISKIDVMAHVNDGVHKPRIDMAKKSLNFGQGVDSDDTYVILFTYKGELTKVKFDPNESMRKEIFKQAPSKVFL